MASLVLGALGSAIGSSFGGIAALGLTGAQIGGFIGSTIGNYVDSALFGSSQVIRQEGPRLSDINITTSTEGAPIPRVYGRQRIAGQLIWASQFKETVTTTTQSSGGGKGIGGGGGASVETTTYTYSISLAVGLCEGEVQRVGRVWADGKILDLSNFTTRFYSGSEAQGSDALFEQIEGTDNTPNYRGLSYLIFEDMPLAQFGNRIPQMQFEVFRSLHAHDPNAADNAIQGIDLIPSAGEFIYATDIITTDNGLSGSSAQNKNNNMGVADFSASLDMMEQLLPNCRSVVLVVSWMGDDLRCGQCTIKPMIEVRDKTTVPWSWRVNGVTRSVATEVSQVEGRPALGGTPADRAVVQAIQDLKARGFEVIFYPFILMDIADGNSLDNPYEPGTSQPTYPWRGRITCNPAPGVGGSPDKSASAATQVSSFFGSATASQFLVTGEQVDWTGGADWGYRRMVLHYAHLCQAAGGVDAFIIGSELIGLTTVRESASAFPAVTQLQSLASDVSTLMPSAKLSYAADWTEYFGYHPEDGSDDVYFHLDPLWASNDIDFIGIDMYWPLSDWRDGQAHLDYEEGRQIYDSDYLQANIEGGEGYDWYYASGADRDSQTRTSIADASYSKPWVYRFKGLKEWWQNSHYNRPGGVEEVSATPWVPESKPIWFTELGCPAIDKGANQPNVFYDPKSSESAVPYYSSSARDDLIQRRYIEAFLEYWHTDNGNNPTSTVYSAPMIDLAHAHVWTWDARAFPDFPSRTSVWSDGPNWRTGHWLNGRIGLVPLADLVRDICAYAGFTSIDVSALFGLVTGFVIDRTMSVRDALQPLAIAFQFEIYESGGAIRFEHKSKRPSLTLTEDDLVLSKEDNQSSFALTRAQETDLPVASRINYIDATADYRQAVVLSRRMVGNSDRVAESNIPLVVEQSFAQGIGDSLIQDAWTMRDKADFALPPSRLALDPSDVIDLTANDRSWRLRLLEIGDTDKRQMRAVKTDLSIYEHIAGPERTYAPQDIAAYGKAVGVFMDLPLLSGNENPHQPYFAAFASPWPGNVALYRSASQSGYSLDSTANAPSKIGTLAFDFYKSGALGRWDNGNELWIDLAGGQLSSKTDLEVLNGANVALVENQDGEFEVVQFVNAELQYGSTYKCTRLLRGQAGTEGAMRNPASAGGHVVLFDGTVSQIGLTEAERTLNLYYRYGPSQLDISDPAYTEEQKQFEGIGYRPYSPGHVRANRESNNDLTLTWKRRTRSGGDSWDQTEVPLGEESESYEVDIMDGASVKRTLSSSTSSLTYSSANQITDWGSHPSTLTLRVYQLSTIFGRGATREVTLNV